MGDLISRQAAIDALYSVDEYNSRSVKAIKQLPPIQPVNNSEIPNSSDVISRQSAIDAVQNRHMMLTKEKVLLINDLEKLPPAQPDIIRCKDCKYASGNSRICLKLGHSPIGELDFCSYAERREDG